MAWNLFRAYRDRGHTSWLAVGFKRFDDPNVVEIPRLPPGPWSHGCWALYGWMEPLEMRMRGVWRLRRWLRILAEGSSGIKRVRGHEDFNFPGSRRVMQLLPQRPDIVHAHNLHGGYFDLRLLPTLSREVPVILTLHDQWLLTGHCAYSIGCLRWEKGCGQCPDLTLYPPLERDDTGGNWRCKQQIYQQSRLHVAAPSQWLLDQVQRSMLIPLKSRVISNGVDLTIYHPVDRNITRAQLGLPVNAIILLFTAQGNKQNRFKDYTTIERALWELDLLATCPVILIALGGETASEEYAGQVKIRHVPYQSDMAKVAQYFQSADIYIHAAHADTFPNTVLEALACGTPVVATAVGGIPEQIEDGKTGFLVPASDSVAMAARIMQLLNDNVLRQQIGTRSAESVRCRFDLQQQVEAYLAWYQELLDTPFSLR